MAAAAKAPVAITIAGQKWQGQSRPPEARPAEALGHDSEHSDGDTNLPLQQARLHGLRPGTQFLDFKAHLGVVTPGGDILAGTGRYKVVLLGGLGESVSLLSGHARLLEMHAVRQCIKVTAGMVSTSRTLDTGPFRHPAHSSDVGGPEGPPFCHVLRLRMVRPARGHDAPRSGHTADVPRQRTRSVPDALTQHSPGRHQRTWCLWPPAPERRRRPWPGADGGAVRQCYEMSGGQRLSKLSRMARRRSSRKVSARSLM